MKRNFRKSDLARSLTAFALILFLLLSSACRRERNVILIVIIDLTGSVPADAQADAFNALQASVRQLRRGDALIVIPLAGDAATELPGRILRFDISRQRKAYDEDLKQLAAEAKRKLEALQRQASENPAKGTDLFGAMLMAAGEARQQMAAAKSDDKEVFVRVLALSDFIQDDAQADFKRDVRLANEAAAKKFAAELAQRKPLALQSSEIYLGLLRSADLKAMNQSRRDAVRVFWTEYCNAGQPKSLQFVMDGPGQAEKFLRETENRH
jgi:hypothetical protein